MNISSTISTQSQTATFSLKEANNISKKEMEVLLSGANQLQQNLTQQKMVTNINSASSNAHIDITV